MNEANPNSVRAAAAALAYGVHHHLTYGTPTTPPLEERLQTMWRALGGDGQSDAKDRQNLAEAWSAVRTALPLAGWLAEDGRWCIPTGKWAITIEFDESGDGYFEPHVEGYRAAAKIEPDRLVMGDYAVDEAEALRSLAERLSQA